MRRESGKRKVDNLGMSPECPRRMYFNFAYYVFSRDRHVRKYLLFRFNYSS